MEDNWYVIKNFEEFIDKTRILVFNNFGNESSSTDIDSLLDSIKPEDEEEFNQILSHDESMIIAKGLAKKQTHKKTKTTRYLVSDKIYYEIIQSLNDRMISNMLNNLVNKGLIETAFDAESNDFIFWVKDNTNK
jgi:Tfp pilus assembly pilus retraction ATPase PilT